MNRVALVTGITGFIGGSIAARLARDDWHVIGLARGRGAESARARATRSVRRHDASMPLSVVKGDLSRPLCGLTPAGAQQLAADVDVVFHCAGDTAFAPENAGAFARGHVSGPVALLERLARDGRLAHWVHLSTAFVCGARNGVVFEHEDDVGQAFHNAYERVKLAAELAIRRAGERSGVPVSVLRPAIVFGPAAGTRGATPSDRLMQFLTLLAHTWRPAGRLGLRLRIEAAPAAILNLVPLDYVVNATVAFGSHPAPADRVFHLVPSAPPTQEQLLELFVQGLDMRGVSLVDARVSPLEHPTLLERAVRRLANGYQEYLLQDVRFDDRNARRALAAYGFAPPRIDGDMVRTWIDMALKPRSAATRAS